MNSLGTYVMLIGQMILSVGVNLYSRVPPAGRGHGLATALGRAILCSLGNLFLVRPCPTAAGQGDND